MMTHLFRILLVLFGYFLLLPAHAQDALKIVASDEWGVELELQLSVPQVQLTELTGDDQQSYLRLQIADWFTTDKIGFPELPRIATLLQVPESGELHATVVTKEEHLAFVPAIYPVPTVTQQSGQGVEQFTKNATAYATNLGYPEQLIEIEPRERLRDVPVARVKVHPFRWNPQTHELRYITQLRFRINFSQALPPVVATQDEPFTPLLRRAINGYTPRQTTLRDAATAPSATLYPQRYTVQMTITDSGMIRLSYADLLAAGLPEACLQQGQFVIYSQGQQLIPQVVMNNGRTFGEADSLEFYATELSNAFVDNNLYRLDCWQFAAPTAQPTSASLTPTRWGNFVNGGLTGAFPQITTFNETIRAEKDLELWEETPGAPEKDFAFWKKITAPATHDITLALTAPVKTSTLPVTVKVMQQGRTTADPYPDHHTAVSLNGHALGDFFWHADGAVLQTFSTTATNLVNGNNKLTIQSVGDTGATVDVVYSNWVELTYERQLTANKLPLTFTLQGNGRRQVELSQISVPAVRLFDVTDPAHFKEVINYGWNAADKTLIFEDDVTTKKTYYLLANDQFAQATRLKSVAINQLRRTNNAADYILITPKAFAAAAELLVTHRKNQGLRAKLVILEDIYEEFGYGFPVPQAIKNFLSYAYQNWQAPAPSYVVLVGNASLDYKNIGKHQKVNLLPPYVIATEFGLAANDNWYANGNDRLPEMMIGRLPGGTAKEVSAIVQKIITYETTPALPDKMLFIADSYPEFDSANDQVAALVPPGITVNKVYLGQYPQTAAGLAQATQDIVARFDEGMNMIQYMGHGTTTLWANTKHQRLFEPATVDKLQANNQPSFISVLNCLNGNFMDPISHALSEEFILAANKGAVGVFAPTSLGYLRQYQLVDNELFKLLFTENVRGFGELTTQSKVRAFTQGAPAHLLDTLVLIGDPATKLKMGVH
jgi:Peptidase family C25/Propeptide_C25